MLSSLAEGARRVKTCRTEEEIRETRRILAAKRDPRRGEQHGRVIRTRASVGNSGKEVTDHLEKLIDDIEISTARYERSPPLITTKTDKYNEDIPHIFTRRHHSNNKWRKARIRKHKPQCSRDRWGILTKEKYDWKFMIIHICFGLK